MTKKEQQKLVREFIKREVRELKDIQQTCDCDIATSEFLKEAASVSFGVKVKTFRKKLGISGHDLAVAMGIHPPNLSTLENSNSRSWYPKIEALEEALKKLTQ